MDDMAQSLQPKERVCSIGYMELSCRLCTKLSYRNAAEMLNLFQHRDAGEAVKLRTLSDSVERVGEQISARLEETTQKVLKMYGFDSGTGRPMEGVCLSSNLTSPAIPEKTEADIRAVDSIIGSVNASRDEKIPSAAEEQDMESSPLECVYVSIDDVGVKHQKSSRSQKMEKDAKHVENTVVHIQHGQDTYALTACGMKNAMKGGKREGHAE